MSSLFKKYSILNKKRAMIKFQTTCGTIRRSSIFLSFQRHASHFHKGFSGFFLQHVMGTTQIYFNLHLDFRLSNKLNVEHMHFIAHIDVVRGIKMHTLPCCMKTNYLKLGVLKGVNRMF